MERRSGNESYWPGFVDALCNLVLTLVFVLIIFILAINYLGGKLAEAKLNTLYASEKLKRSDLDVDKVKQMVVQGEETKKELDRILLENRSYEALVKKYEQKIADLEHAVDVARAGGSGASNGAVMELRKTSGQVKIDRSGNTATLYFERGEYTPNDTSKSAISRLVEDGIKAHGPGVQIALLSKLGDETYSEAKRNGYYRLLYIRGMLVNAGVKPERIATNLDSGQQNTVGSVQLEFKPGGGAP